MSSIKKSISEEDFANLSDSELDAYLEKLIAIKKPRGTAATITEIKEKSAHMLYWNSDSFKELSELHAKYELPKFNFSILLYRAICNKNLKFAVDLLLNGYIPHMCCPEGLLCEEVPHLDSLIELCIEKENLSSFNLVTAFCLLRHANHHEWKLDALFSDQCNHVCIKPLIEKNITYSSRTSKCTDDSWCSIENDHRLIKSYALRATAKTNNVEIIKSIINNYDFKNKYSCIQSYLSPLVRKLVDEENKELLNFIKQKTWYKRGNYTQNIITEYKLISKIRRISNNSCPPKTCIECLSDINESNIGQIDINVFTTMFAAFKEKARKEKIDPNMMAKLALLYHNRRAEYAVMAEKCGRDDIIECLLTLFDTFEE